MQTINQTIASLDSAVLSATFALDSMVELMHGNGLSGSEIVNLYAIWNNNEGPEPTNYAITNSGDPEMYGSRIELESALEDAARVRLTDLNIDTYYLDDKSGHEIEHHFWLAFAASQEIHNWIEGMDR